MVWKCTRLGDAQLKVITTCQFYH